MKEVLTSIHVVKNYSPNTFFDRSNNISTVHPFKPILRFLIEISKHPSYFIWIEWFPPTRILKIVGKIRSLIGTPPLLLAHLTDTVQLGTYPWSPGSLNDPHQSSPHSLNWMNRWNWPSNTFTLQLSNLMYSTLRIIKASPGLQDELPWYHSHAPVGRFKLLLLFPRSDSFLRNFSWKSSKLL